MGHILCVCCMYGYRRKLMESNLVLDSSKLVNRCHLIGLSNSVGFAMNLGNNAVTRLFQM